ncbi:helix-turn-helix transcriptional regulator [Geomonas paludis]|uniref:Transcriptional regulator n=1 Tax=Geomonas paludis TaxID=2740185 RepID=A0A6V8MTE5_9BACT|nr:AlpA family phage regulatory protein [Geomonas paludis]GFO63164.1 hypothetical protein GMPD_10830 [Geomonas paludis]
MEADKVIRRRELLQMIGVSAATQWRLEKAGLFPRRIRVGRGAVGWHLAEVEEWLKSRDRVERHMVQRTSGRRAADRALREGVLDFREVASPSSGVSLDRT